MLFNTSYFFLVCKTKVIYTNLSHKSGFEKATPKIQVAKQETETATLDPFHEPNEAFKVLLLNLCAITSFIPHTREQMLWQW